MSNKRTQNQWNKLNRYFHRPMPTELPFTYPMSSSYYDVSMRPELAHTAKHILPDQLNGSFIRRRHRNWIFEN